MDDLISRKALQEALCTDTEEGTFEFTEEQVDAADKTIRYIVKTIQSVPSVPAVPLEPLCEFLARSETFIPCETCDSFVNQACSEYSNVLCPHTADDWRKAITKWMEGLDDD